MENLGGEIARECVSVCGGGEKERGKLALLFLFKGFSSK